jgi:hypothetical protein
MFCCSCPDNIFTDPAVATLNVIVTTLALVAVIDAGSTTLLKESYTVITGYAVFKLCVTVQVVAAENVCWNPLTADNDPFNDNDPLIFADPETVNEPEIKAFDPVMFLASKSRLLAIAPSAVTPSYISKEPVVFLRIPKSLVH